ncbi:protein maelstrom homolog [Gigantopelta aegis]|uniref:protein maelstrom homolog n=1 Tax=Gigantopelta aegis TaxID=1735272 RepID=UPI001B8890FC|nr:protein maelstrom homolog [Gigantopelta aegis]
MPKKSVRNAFYFFMKELEPKLRKEGRVFPNGMADIVPLAHPQWKALSDNEKARFERMAKEYKASMRGVDGDKYRLDNVGNIIADRKDPMKEMEKRHKRERQAVVAPWVGKDIMDEVFYFINFQILCCTEDGHYLPCEMAILEYSLRKGIIRHYHKFVCPGAIPTGYRFDCMNHSERTHQIPVENFELADANYIGLWTQIENFINYRGEKPEDPPLYCLNEDIDKTEYCLAWIAQQSCLGRPQRLKKVYELVGLVVDLYANAGHPNMSPSRVQDHLSVNTWDFTRNTRCDWHEEHDCKFCSLGIVRRYAFAISDSLSALLEFPLTDKHIPSTKDDGPACITLPPTSYSVKPNPAQMRSSRGRGRGSNWVPGRSSALNRPQQTFQSRRNDFGDDDDDDDDVETEPEGYKTSVRRPNMPVMWTPVPKVQESVQESNLDTGDTNEWPSLGGPAPVKFAGRASAPDPRQAPFPPNMWQSGGDLGQYRDPEEEAMSVKSVMQGQTIPLQETSPAPPSFPQMRIPSIGEPAPSPATPAMGPLMGQGRGRGVLGQSGQNRPPVGRGYAPPIAGRGIGRGTGAMGRGYIQPGMVIAQQGLQNMSFCNGER